MQNFINADFARFVLQFAKEKNKTPFVFLSGAISERIYTYKEEFDKVERMLKFIGIKEIYNPSIMPVSTPWEKAMKETLKNLPKSDCIFVLKNWENSEGTKKEISQARNLGIPVFFQ